ncbi:16S rRNA (guanine(527)-N(7))-methyltransferase RsmG [Sulfidibacter corallicola]|uniref:Ribosomal RNA small subunit methyltransferase G n=1 Tax=Sulfidibacter corallicola TaxID=2818388 RepID=A0A8A4TX70_SULCO|nr:RsmG family class I SAM-dependent methyltransferase [Sulfidibacter corallicola]QTD54080.1 class I SAM-dependent methyltransferase [Sulfidibacter corallicola]
MNPTIEDSSDRMPQWCELLDAVSPALEKLGVTESKRAGLVSYLTRLWAENQRINLFSRKMTPERLIEDHLLDSLLGLSSLPRVEVVADLGTGGGFPAIPLALCRPRTRFLLYEKSPLKCRFLASLADLQLQIEVVGPLPADGSLPREVDLVTARAFKPIAVILELTREYRRRNGAYMLYKARRAKIDEELAAVRGNCQARIQALEPIGEAEERHLVWL